MSRSVHINEAFRGQRVTGQQRYATEIDGQLPQDFVRVFPGRFWVRHAALVWIWVQVVLPIRTRNGVLISMTARAPLWHPRHVVVVHDLFVIDHPEWYSWFYRLTHRPLLRLHLIGARALVAVSEPVAARLRGQRVRGPIVVAANAPSDAFTPSATQDPPPGGGGNTVLAKYGLSPGGYLVAVGNVDPRKNWERLAAAWGRLSPADRSACPLVIVGGESRIYRSGAVTWPPETRLLGYVGDDDLRELYRASAAFVLMSLAEGFGLPIVEAIGAGAPRLLVADIPVFRWICGESAGYVDPLSVENMAAALEPASIEMLPPADPAVASRFTWSHSASVIRAQSSVLAS